MEKENCSTRFYPADLTVTDRPALAQRPTRSSSDSLSTLLRVISAIRGCTTPIGLSRFDETLALEDLRHVLAVDEYVSDEPVVDVAAVRDKFHRSAAKQLF